MRSCTRFSNAMLVLCLLSSSALAHLSLIRLGRESAGEREQYAGFGSAVAAGDFDGDGYEDLASGAPKHRNGHLGLPPTGMVVVNFGSRHGLTHDGALGLLFNTSDFTQRFGHALAAGDFDGDGRDDLAVGSPLSDEGMTNDAGHVLVYEGVLGGIEILPALDVSMIDLATTPAEDDEFGAALATGRFDDDTYDDLAIGIPGRSGNAGMIAVLYGSASGLDVDSVDFFTAIDFAFSDPNGRFGAALASGHQYGDASDELAIGAPGSTVGGLAGAGRVYMAQGSTQGLLALFPIVLSAAHFGLAPSADAQFGAALATGRFFDDGGLLDLAIGEPGFATATGRVIVTHLNTPNDGADQFIHFSYDDLGTAATAGDRFGSVLAAGDSDLDGDDELAIGAPMRTAGNTSGAGAAVIVSRQDTNLLDKNDKIHAQALNAEYQLNGAFGTALCFGQFDGSNQANLAVGSPDADYKHWDWMEQLGFLTLPASGQVHIYAPWRQARSLKSRSAAALNCDDELVFSQRPFDELAIASTTKTMTVLLAAEDIQNGLRNPEDEITIEDDLEWIVDFAIGSGETLIKGETITLINLMRLAVCISSGEACYAIAALLTDEVDPFPANFPNPPQSETDCDPSFPIVQPTFVARMNQRASQLGMLDTQFTNPHGSRSGSCFGGQRHHSTAYDMALLARAAMECEFLVDFLDPGSYTVDRETMTMSNCTNPLLSSLRQPGRLGERAMGIKRGNSGYADDTGVASYAPGIALVAPSVATIFGTPSASGDRETGLTTMLKVADQMCVGQGPNQILPPLDPDPPAPLASLIGIPAGAGSIRNRGLKALTDLPQESIELHVQRWQSHDASTQLEACFGLVEEVELGPGELVQLGIAPFEEFRGARLRNAGSGTAQIQLMVLDPPSSQIVALAPSEEFVLPPATGSGASFSWSVQNASSASSANLVIEELGYCFELDLGLDPRGNEEIFQASLVADAAGIFEYRMLSWEFIGQDSTPENTIAFSATFTGGPTGTEGELGPPSRASLRAKQYPNPFNPRTTIEFTLAQSGPARVSIFDVRGRRVRLLGLSGSYDAGTHRLLWDGMDASGNAMASGVYHWRVESAEGSAEGRMALLR